MVQSRNQVEQTENKKPRIEPGCIQRERDIGYNEFNENEMKTKMLHHDTFLFTFPIIRFVRVHFYVLF